MKKITNFILFVLVLLMSLLVLDIDLNKKAKHQGKISGAYEALSLWGESRAFPNKSIPKAASYSAFEYSKRELTNELSKTHEVEPWETLGPHNKGGRTLAVAINPENPNTIYAGSASGGLWRSYTRGEGAAGWHYVSTGFPVLGVMAIAIDPADTNIMYIGTGEVYNWEGVGFDAAVRITRGSYGIGILKTVDGGKTWSKSLDWTYDQQKGVQAIKIDPTNSNIIWAGTTDGTYKSTDRGQNWDLVYNVIMTNDIIIHPTDPDIVVAAHGNFGSPGHGLYRTTNGGGDWTKIEVGVPIEFFGKGQLTVCNSSPNVMYYGVGNSWGGNFFPSAPPNKTWLSKSTDSGTTWQIVNDTDWSLWQGWFAHDVAVDPTNPDIVYAVGIQIWRSLNGGNSFVQISGGSAFAGQTEPGAGDGNSRYSHADHHDIAIYENDPSIVYFANDGGVFRSLNADTDNANSIIFEGVNGGYQTTQFYSGVSVTESDSELVIGGLQDNGTIIYRGTLAWQRWAFGGDGSWTGINQLNPQTMYFSSQNLNIVRSLDGGVNRNNIIGIAPPFFERSTSFIAPFVVSNSNPSIIYAARDQVYKSTNSGSGWTITNSGDVLDGNFVLTMAMSKQDEDLVYAATAPVNNSTQGVFRTENGGDSWTRVDDGLPELYPGDVYVDPSNHDNVYVTYLSFNTSLVFKSNNRGDTWTDITSNLPRIPTTAIAVDPENSNHLYIGNDIGMYVSTNGGDSWEEYSDGLPDAIMVTDLNIQNTAGKIVLTSHGNGAYRRDLMRSSTDVDDKDDLPNEFVLIQNYPNPFNPGTIISYQLSTDSDVKLSIYDILGNEIEVLVNGQKAAGSYEVSFDGSNLSTGVYFYVLQAGNFSDSKKMLLLR